MTKQRTRRTSRRWTRIVPLIAAGSLVAAACGGNEVATTEVAAGETSAVYDLTATTVDGSQLDFGSLEGQDAVLWFWAPW